MKKYGLLPAILLVVLLLAGCKDGKSPATPEQPPAASADSTEKGTAVALETLLEDIWEAAPGTAGCSLKQAKAAGELLDWAQAQNTADAVAVEAWLTETDPARGDLAEAYAQVLDFADRVLEDDAQTALEWEDAGYTPIYDRYDAALYHQAARSLSPIFTRILDAWEVTSSYVFEDPTPYAEMTMDQFDGIWCDGEMQELLIVSNGKCRAVIPYLDQLGDTAYAVRLRDRSDKDYCPALEVDVNGDFSGALTYYISGVDASHFWSNTQAQRFEKVPEES